MAWELRRVENRRYCPSFQISLKVNPVNPNRSMDGLNSSCGSFIPSKVRMRDLHVSGILNKGD